MVNLLKAASLKSIAEQTRLTLQMMVRMIRILFKLTPAKMTFLSAAQISTAIIPVLQVYVTIELVHRTERVIQDGSSQFGPAFTILLYQLLLFLLQLALEVYVDFLVNKIKLAALLHFGQEVNQKSSRLSLLHFENHEFYDLLQRVSTGLEYRGMQFFQSFLQIAKNLITIAGFVIVLLGFHWLLAFGILLLIVPSLYIDIKESGFKVSQFVNQTPFRRRSIYFSSLLTEREWAKEVRIFGLADYFIQQWRKYTRQNGQEQIDLERKMSIFKVAVNGFLLVMVTLISGFLLTLAAAGAMTIASFVALIQTIFSVQTNLKTMAVYIAGIYEQALYTTDLFRFLAMKEEESDDTPKLPLPASLEHGISVKNLEFVYPTNGRTILRDISFEVSMGEKIAIVGENGAGKSTLAKCLLGLYQPTAGTITYNGIPLDQMDTNEFRERVTAIFQDFAQYQLTLRENIGVGHVEWMQEEARLQAAAAKSGVDDFFHELSEGFDTELGHKFFGGHELSHGQWQKIAISRAFFRDSDIIVLDEPTSALDPMAEAQLFEHIAQLTKGKTTFFISHRLGICRAADRILVLKDGRLVEQGSHDELMALDGEYAGMFRTQAEWYQ
ncbi:ABC transporter ATP-binding protein [Paenibacillus pinisoli]|uniref:ABC transporter ATP-binding protein n=1 Tax=Paenibacillus pinisoli TaxID=1276110 RepID=A0A3A6PEA4_9BACL|nr:ABC transporter ATP-binding protein [Paenibacillus pinisoli]